MVAPAGSNFHPHWLLQIIITHTHTHTQIHDVQAQMMMMHPNSRLMAAGSVLLLALPTLVAFQVPRARRTVSGSHLQSVVTLKDHDMYAHHHDMFCNQCEQTNNGVACTVTGVCGKTSECAACQDTLSEILKGVGLWATAARKAGVSEEELREANEFTLRATFSTLTNVNFDDEVIADFCRQGARVKKQLEKLVCKSKGEEPDNDPTMHEGGWIQKLIGKKMVDYDFEHMTTIELEEFGYLCQTPKQEAAMGDKDAFSLHQAAMFGLRGACAYEAHCLQLDALDTDVMKDIHEIWAKLASKEPDTEGLLATVLKVGDVNARVMAALDQAHVDQFGTPEITEVKKTAVEGKAILVSGHDIKDCKLPAFAGMHHSFIYLVLAILSHASFLLISSNPSVPTFEGDRRQRH